MDKKRGILVSFTFLSILFSCFILSAYSQTIPNPGHGGDTIFINANGDKNLQQAIDEKSLCSLNSGSYSGNVDFGQKGEDISVFTNNIQKNLQQGINAKELSLANSLSTFSSIISGHNASQIWISIGNVEKTLQQAINAGDFGPLCCTPTCAGKLCGASDGCTGTCVAGSGCCTPVCVGKTCGSSDGCTGTCVAGSGCTTPVPITLLNVITGKSCDTLCSERGGTCIGFTGGISGAPANYFWCYPGGSARCSVCIGSCAEVMHNHVAGNCPIGSYPSDWSYCTCSQ